jgi:hypothetical protein
MTPSLRRVGEAQAPVVVADDFTGDLPRVLDLAAALAPFPAAENHYPGLRRRIARDEPAYAYVQHALRAAAPLIGRAFGGTKFELLEASFSMVTASPTTLTAPQRMPHFDSADPGYLALLHYLSDTPGTAFYRQRSTGIERVDEASAARFVATARAESAGRTGYVAASDTHFEQIGAVEGRADRLVIYQGALLHSGIIPGDATFSDDPRAGRLTANFFVQLRS